MSECGPIMSASLAARAVLSLAFFSATSTFAFPLVFVHMCRSSVLFCPQQLWLSLYNVCCFFPFQTRHGQSSTEMSRICSSTCGTSSSRLGNACNSTPWVIPLIRRSALAQLADERTQQTQRLHGSQDTSTCNEDVETMVGLVYSPEGKFFLLLRISRSVTRIQSMSNETD